MKRTVPLRPFVIALIMLSCLLMRAKGADTAQAGAATLAPGARFDDTSAAQSTLKWYTMFANIPGDWVRYSNQTFRLSTLPAAFGMAFLTGALVATDEETWTLSHRFYHGSAFVKSGSDLFEYMGDGRPQFGLAGAFALYGFVANDERALRTASQTVEAILACGSVVQVLKHVTGRESPFLSTRPGGVWDLFPNQIQYHKHVARFDAFPSGHIATAMTTVTVVAENYPEWEWVRPLGYTIVAIIGVSMGNTGIHWYSDYPLGLALGYSFGMLAAHPERPVSPEASKSGAPSVSVLPMITPDGGGLAVALSF